LNKFTYIELFAGIGGFRQALDPLGGQCVFASEIDKFAQQSYKTLYGDGHLHGDITQVDEKDVPNHDVLVGGFPCQAFSVAGKRLGFADETRGTLFFEIVRIMREKKPKIAVLENVKGLVGHDKGKTLDTVVTTLNEIGYTVDFDVLNSKYFGVPQNRERIFIVAVRDDLVDTEEWRITGTNVVAKGKRRIAQIDGVKTFNFDFPQQAEVTTSLRDILEDSVGERYYLSEEKTAKLVAQLNEKEATADSNDSVMVGHADIRGNDSIKRVYSPVGDTPTLTTMGGGHREPKIAEIAKPDNLSYCIDANYAKGIAPNGIGKGRRTHVEEVHALTERRTDEAKQLRREYRDKYGKDFSPRRGKEVVPREDGIGNCVTATQTIEQTLLEKPRYRIRKLTPLECWRLQGFSDEAHALVKDASISDSQRYKQAGNAVTVNVIDAIGKRLITYLK
jgi:DNA (cytosine-5)-methyltransferase 1